MPVVNKQETEADQRTPLIVEYPACLRVFWFVVAVSLILGGPVVLSVILNDPIKYRDVVIQVLFVVGSIALVMRARTPALIVDSRGIGVGPTQFRAWSELRSVKMQSHHLGHCLTLRFGDGGIIRAGSLMANFWLLVRTLECLGHLSGQQRATGPVIKL